MRTRKCHYCNRQSKVWLRYARLHLCEKHYKEYIVKRVLKTIERYKLIREGDKILIAVSGGKDSMTLLDILLKIREQINFEYEIVHIDLGIPEYSTKAREIVENYCIKRNLKVNIVDLEKLYGLTIKLIKTKLKTERVCSYCSLIRRRILNDVANNLNCNKIATGHNMDDMLSFFFKAIRMHDTKLISRIKPMIESKSEGLLKARIRPLFELSDKETFLYTLLARIPILNLNCPFYHGAKSIEYKRWINLMEEKEPGYKISTLRFILKHIVPKIESSLKEEEYKKCVICGYPTRGREKCAFCQIMERIRKN